jgi:CheY-like chemotaxis protein/signal recognition particle receptor subunit beta
MEVPNILVIDGDPKNLQILKESLEASNFKVIVCNNGNQALGIIQSQRPDIIVSEVDIPGLNGLELLEKLQKDPAAAAIPLVFLTNRRNLEDRLKSLRSGVKDYMIKPLHVKEVIARLQMILRRLERLRHEEAQSNKKIVGRLEEKSVEALVEECGLQRKSGVLSLYDENNRSGEIYFRDGAVVNARLGNFKAEKAVYQMLPWNHGHYVMDFKEINVEDEITVSNLGLLVQGVKQLEERGKLLKQLPELDTIFQRTSIFEQILKRKTIAADALKFVALFDGNRSLSEILAESTFDDIKTLEKILKLYQQGFIRPLNGEIEKHPQKPVAAPLSFPQKVAPIPTTVPKLEKELEFRLPSQPMPKIEPKIPARVDPKAPTKLEQQPAPKIEPTLPKPEPAPRFTPKPIDEETKTFIAITDKQKSAGIEEKSAPAEKLPAPFELPKEPPQQKEPVGAPQRVGATSANGGMRKDPESAPKPSSSKFGGIFDQLFNGSPHKVGRFVIVSSDSENRRNLISILSQNNFQSKTLDQNGGLTFELARLTTPGQRGIEILGVSTERKFLQMIEQLSDTMIGYVVLIGDSNISNLGYAGYLINSLKRQLDVPHVIVTIQSKNKRAVPLDVVRYTLKLDESEQLLEVDVRDLEAVKHLLIQLQPPAPPETNGQSTTTGAISHRRDVPINN